MPLVRIDMIKGKSAEYKKQMFECVHAGLEESSMSFSTGNQLQLKLQFIASFFFFK